MVGSFGGTKSAIAGVASIFVMVLALRGLNKKLATLDGDFKTKLSYESFLKQHKAIKRSTTSKGYVVGKLEETVAQLEKELESKDKDMRGLKERLDAKDKEFRDHEERLDAKDEKLRDHEERLDSKDEKLTDHDKRLTTKDKEMRDLNERLTAKD